MPLSELESLRDSAWLYVAAPLLALAALALTAVLGVPQLRRLGDAFRALREHDPDALGETTPGAAVMLSAAASVGAAATLGAVTAVSLGGAGSLFWVWLFAFLVAPLRYAEVILARTDAPGLRDRARVTSFAGRLMREGKPLRVAGFVLLALAIVTGFAFVGGVHGAALEDAARTFFPGSVAAVGYGVAVLAALAAVLGVRKSGVVLGFVALAGLALLVLAALFAAATEPSRAFGALGRALTEAWSGAPEASPFTGAFAGEIVVAAVLHVAPALGAPTGTVGAIHSAARAKATKRQAAVALLGPLAFAVVTTLAILAVVATGTFFRRVHDSRPFADIRVLTVAFETASQRIEPERMHGHSGPAYMRIVDGEARDLSLVVATERGTIVDPKYTFRGRPADVALRLRDGRAVGLLRPKEGTLSESPLSELRDLRVEGEMLPRGARLYGVALDRAGTLASRLAFAALLVLCAVGAAAWGMGLGRSLPTGVPAWAPRVVAVVPAAGLALAATGAAPWLPAVGGLAAALVAAVSAVLLMAKAREAR
jgi:AGCS family alanine or glycine:cation symporter